MTPPAQKTRNTHKTRWKRALSPGSAVIVAALTGCASQGPLRPPSLHLPAPVRGLAAQRAGSAVDLRWTNPTRTTDGLPLNGKHVPLPIQVDICREEALRAPCIPLGRVPAGTAAFHDALPDALAAGVPRLLRYQVRTVNGNGRGTAAVAVQALAGLAPIALENVEAAPADNGVLIRWKPIAGIESSRILLHVRRGEPTRTAATKDGDTLLAVEAGPGNPAGTLDTGAKPGVAQQYSLERERTVHLREGDFRIASAAVMVSVDAAAKLPAVLPPAGLQAVVNTLAAPEIDLVWQPVASATGYLVFRAVPPETPALLTATPIQGLSYSDAAVRPGVRYRYSVSAVGRDGTPGARSAAIEESVPAN